jgi:aminopeptidase N
MALPLIAALRPLVRRGAPLVFAGLAAFAASRSRALPSFEKRERLDHTDHEEARAKRARMVAEAIGRASYGALPPSVEGRDRGFDILSYDLWFGLDPAVRFLQGETAIRLAGTAAETREVTLDFDDAYTIDGITRDGRTIAPLSRGSHQLVLPVDPPLRGEERASLAIVYHGVPPAYGALSFWSHGTGWAATSVAEPFGARTFWPCVDDPADRAVTTVHATVPAGYVVASAGVSEVVDEADGRRTFTWRFPKAISTYLVSLNVSNYTTVEDEYTGISGQTMPIRSYLLPEHVSWNVPKLAAMRKHLETQASLFGEYPFIDTKYGIVESGFSGGMEHPTMTSIGTAQLGSQARDLTILLVHELTHQWWGDRVTMRTWDDIFLNEGFATYGEVLYREKAEGVPPGNLLTAAYDDGRYAGLLGSTVVASPAAPFGNTGSVYQKGAWVLHMLRRLVGDDIFFPALRGYGDAHAYGTASRADLRHDFERATGGDLKQFFDQWVETPCRPILRATWQNAAGGSGVTVTVTQTQPHTVVHPVAAPGDTPWYRFPLTVRIFLADGTAVDRTLPIDAATTTVTLPIEAKKSATGILLDPNGDLLKVVESVGPG